MSAPDSPHPDADDPRGPHDPTAAAEPEPTAAEPEPEPTAAAERNPTPAEAPFVPDRQRAGWGSPGQPTYDRRKGERRGTSWPNSELTPDANRRAEHRRADDRWLASQARRDADDSSDGLRRPPLARATPNIETSAGAGRLLAVILVIIVAFAGGVAVDQAAWRGATLSGPGFATAPPGPGGSVRPPATPLASNANQSGSPLASDSSVPGTAVPGTPGTPAPSPQSTPGPTLGPGATVPPFAPANIGILWDALKLIEEHWVRRSQTNPTDLAYGAINGLVDALGDPGHTTFLTPDQVKSENQALSGQIIGIGVFLGLQGGSPFIQSVVSGSPAAKSGVLSGDRIIAIDGASAENLSLDEIARLVRGEEGTQVTLTVIHAHGNTPLNITITRAKITVPAVTWTLLPGTSIADIRISEFSSGTTDQFVSALRGARQANAKSIILDLRNNPGGYVDDAVGVVSQFLASGTVYIRQTADGKQIPVAVKSAGVATDLPLAVLVDYGSASSAEITAGALQDANRGPLIGTRTYGTGTVLNTFNLPDGSAIRLGVEEWLTPKGRAIFPNGIQPDQEVDLPGDTPPLEPDEIRSMTAAELEASPDTQLLRAMQDLAGR